MTSLFEEDMQMEASSENKGKESFYFLYKM